MVNLLDYLSSRRNSGRLAYWIYTATWSNSASKKRAFHQLVAFVSTCLGHCLGQAHVAKQP